MPRLSPRLGALVSCIFLYVFAACVFSSAVAYSQGIDPTGVLRPFDVDTVDAKSGNVFINIPLASIPQRGQPKSLGISLIANSDIWTPTESCSIRTNGAGQPPVKDCTYAYINQSTAGPSFASPNLFSIDSTGSTFVYPESPTLTRTQVIPWAVDGTGARHQLWFDASDPTQARSIDGSEIRSPTSFRITTV